MFYSISAGLPHSLLETAEVSEEGVDLGIENNNDELTNFIDQSNELRMAYLRYLFSSYTQEISKQQKAVVDEFLGQKYFKQSEQLKEELLSYLK